MVLGLFYTEDLAAAIGWKALFWEHLYPARNKWSADEHPVIDNKIAVAIRMRQIDEDKPSDIVLPLHQRLRMLKKGQKITAKEALGEAGLSYEEIQSVVREEGGIDPDLLALVLEAKQLHYAGSAASRTARKHKAEWEDDEPTAASSLEDAHAAAGQPDSSPDMALAGSSAAPAAQGARADGRPGHGECAGEAEAPAARPGARVLSVEAGAGTVRMLVPGVGVRAFRFPTVFDGSASQAAVFSRFAEAACVAAANGFNACLLAYGQTGSGKTHTVFGPPGVRNTVVSQVPRPAAPSGARRRRGDTDCF